MSEKNQDERYEDLAKKWLEGHISSEEKTEFDNWYNEFDDSHFEAINRESYQDLKNRNYQAVLEKENIHSHRVKKIIPWKRMVAAAAILLLMTVGGWLLTHKKPQASLMANTIMPGGNKAVLTLASGKQIILTDAGKGILAKENNTEITKASDGQIIYGKSTTSRTNQGPELVYNTMTTPRGGQYWVSLADGSKVLLNAASSLKYPVTFSGKERKVELTGEAYFEVAKDKAHPFTVQTTQQTVQVLGTHFSINSYNDEPEVKTTLFEGSIKVADLSKHHSGILKPGQQSILTANNLDISVVNTEEALAWKNGYFMFESEPITSVMRKISRWYDVEVIYDGPPPSDKFGGTVNRFASVSQILKKLALTNKVHFKIEERRIIVSK